MDQQNMQVLLKNDLSLLNEIFGKLFSQESLLSIRNSAKADSLILQSQSHRFLYTFCKEHGFEIVTADENFNITSICTKVLRDSAFAKRLGNRNLPFKQNDEANDHQKHRNNLLADDWELLSEMLAQFNSRENSLTIWYKEATDSLEITSRSRHFLCTLCEEDLLANGSVNSLIKGKNRRKDAKSPSNLTEEEVATSKESNGSSKLHSDRYVKALLNDDKATVDELYPKCRRAITQMILKRKGDISDVDDVLHDALIYIIEKAKEGNLKLTKGLVGYLCTICKNKWYDKCKEDGKIVFKELDNTSNYGCSENPVEEAEKLLESQKLLEHVTENFEKLSKRSRELVILWLKGESWKQVGAKLNITPGSARKNKCKIFKRLKTLMPHSLMCCSRQKLDQRCGMAGSVKQKLPTIKNRAA